jgi:hypothetical protein
MPALQKKYISVGPTDLDKATKRAWSAADFAAVTSASDVARTNWFDQFGTESTITIKVQGIGFANQIDQLRTIVLKNVKAAIYGEFASTPRASTGVAADLGGISAILARHFQQVPSSPWAQINEKWLTWSGAAHQLEHPGKVRTAVRSYPFVRTNIHSIPTQISRGFTVAKGISDFDDRVDWDVRIETRPMRRNWTVKMQFKRETRQMPRLRDNPYE